MSKKSAKKRKNITIILVVILGICTFPRMLFAQNPGLSWDITNKNIGQFADWAVSSTSHPERIVGDFNGDGRSDIALLGTPSWASVPLAFSDGSGGFDVFNNHIGQFATWATVSVSLVADFNGDGLTDIALSGAPNWATMPIAFSDGSGGWNVTNGHVGEFAIWAEQNRKFVGDFNGDGMADVALTGGVGWTTIPIALSDGNGGWNITNGQVSHLGISGEIKHARVGDFNGDGLDDLALGSNEKLVAFSDGSGGWLKEKLVANPVSKKQPILPTPRINLNNDGRSDLIGGYGGNITVKMADGMGGWQVFSHVIFSGRASRQVGDFNNDGLSDLIFFRDKPPHLLIALADGTGKWIKQAFPAGKFHSWTTQTGTRFVRDFNGDGFDDVGLIGGSEWTTLPVAFTTAN